MKSVMISIQPRWCELITCKKRVKTVEIRKTRPKIAVPFKCYIYQTKKPVTVSFSGTGKHISEYDKTYFYNDRSGRVIGEFVCDGVQEYECEFVDDECYEEIASILVDEDEDRTGFIEWSNDSGLSYGGTDLYRDSCIRYSELKKYMGVGFGTFYGWHISNLVIYDEPKELSDFYSLCEKGNCRLCDWEREYDSCGCNRKKPIERPPQSWCYVEGKEDEGK